jgi:hypothetical protein
VAAGDAVGAATEVIGATVVIAGTAGSDLARASELHISSGALFSSPKLTR